MFVGPTAARVSKWTKIYIVVTYVYPSGAQYSIPIKAYSWLLKWVLYQFSNVKLKKILWVLQIEYIEPKKMVGLINLDCPYTQCDAIKSKRIAKSESTYIIKLNC